MNNELLIKNLKSNNSEVISNNEEKQIIEDMANTYYDAMLKARGTLGSMNEGAPKWYAKAFFNAGYRKQEWISVEDRLPERSGDYLTYHEHGNCGVIYYNADIKLWNVYYSDDVRNAIRSITHWMPLPEAPKMKGGEQG